MATKTTAIVLGSYATFGALLRYLRRRARLTQRELGIDVGYSEGHICHLECNARAPDLTALAALFVPVLELADEPETVTRLLQLAATACGEKRIVESVPFPNPAPCTGPKVGNDTLANIAQDSPLSPHNLPASTTPCWVAP